MTLGIEAVWLYAGAMVAIWLTPGPVWVAIIARGLSSGWSGVWPLSIGVAIGDFIWPLIAIFGLSLLVGQAGELLEILRWIAVVVFIGMGLALLWHANRPVEQDGRLTRRGKWAGFSAGLLAIVGNPKAALFYVGVLPGFFQVQTLTGSDVLVIALMSALIPAALNLGMGAIISAARTRLATPKNIRRMNLVSGWLLIVVGVVIGVGQVMAG
ncbi:LysE family translocator [Paracoccus caeni]|uniref:LysE family translocator n=1 Tax=Paracoccus caeni TaxID=657651 RepID=A0A934VT64_9RHOB|nr:LysE family translocator [Paracoccus caeni]MBK4214396.1 LysE family translocator [Paracoccus caeni]